MNALPEYFTSVNALLFFGIASGVLSTFAYIPYIIDTIAGRTQPQRASWLIWSVLGSIAFMSQIYEGATSSLWFAGVQVTGTIIVFALSIRGGKGNYLSKTDYTILVAAAAGLVLWYFTETAAYALAITISISLLGGIATVAKAYRDPDSETLITWVISLIASVCAIFSVGKFDLIILAYPLYLFTLYIAFVVAIVLGRLNKRHSARDRAISARRFYFPPATSVLRTTADSIIVCAAVIFSVSWLNSNNGQNKTTAVSSMGASHFPSSPDINDTFTGNRLAASIETPTKSELTPEPFTQPSITTTASLGDLESAVLVVAFRLDQHGSTQFWKLGDNDPLTEQLRIKLARQHSGDENLFQPPRPDHTQSTSLQPLNPTPVSNFPESTTPVAIGTMQLTNAPGDSKNFQFLDSYDPFTQLTVTSANARLINAGFQTARSEIILPHGTTLKAIATDGGWFRVRTAQGDIGYVSRDNVTPDALAMAQ